MVSSQKTFGGFYNLKKLVSCKKLGSVRSIDGSKIVLMAPTKVTT